MMASRAEAQLDFLFSENVSGGTITGEIEGLAPDATSTPTDIIIFSQPSGYPIGPTDLVQAGYIFLSTDDTFTVTSGQITAADLGIIAAVGGGYQGYAFNGTNAFLGLTNANGIFQANSFGTIIKKNSNNSGFAGATYTPVPEPRRTMVFFLLATVALFAVRKFRARIAL
jgi:hypothetical protein